MSRRSTERGARDVAEQAQGVAVSRDASTIAGTDLIDHGERQAALVLFQVLQLRTKPATSDR